MSDDQNTPAQGAETTALPVNEAPTAPAPAPVEEAPAAPAPEPEPAPKPDDEAQPTRQSKRTAG